jgi:hypothetical protein
LVYVAVWRAGGGPGRNWLDDELEVVLPADRSALLHEEVSWKAENERILVWFATTNKEVDFHKKKPVGNSIRVGSIAH